MQSTIDYIRAAMWWEPQSRSEQSVASAIAQLRPWFHDQIFQEAPLAWGIGSIWDPDREALAPLILLNRGLFPVPMSSFASFSIEFARALNARADEIPRIDSNIPTRFVPVSRPHPASVAEDIFERFVPVRNPIICGRTGKLGTAGVAVWDDRLGQPGLLTAGHVFPHGLGSPVMQQHSFLRLRRQTPLGYVTHHIAPNGPHPQWDAAMIQTRLSVRFYPELVRRIFERFTRPEPIVVHGAMSGSVSQAAVHQGALEEVGSGELMWTRCWMVGPSGVLTGGDSGAAVFIRGDSSFLGVFVGSSYFADTDRAFVHYVQDAASLESSVLRPWGVRFRRWPR